MVEETRRAIEDGKCVVIGLQNTGEVSALLTCVNLRVYC